MKNKMVHKNDMLSIGEVAARSGTSVASLRFYESKGLIFAMRSSGGTRFFPRATLRRLGFIQIAKNFGYSLAEIQRMLATLPERRTPTAMDWNRISLRFQKDIDTRIKALENLRDKLGGCIGCGCLSLKRCALYNPEDQAAQRGTGAQFAKI